MQRQRVDECAYLEDTDLNVSARALHLAHVVQVRRVQPSHR
jgi:hypothetical protein